MKNDLSMREACEQTRFTLTGVNDVGTLAYSPNLWHQYKLGTTQQYTYYVHYQLSYLQEITVHGVQLTNWLPIGKR